MVTVADWRRRAGALGVAATLLLGVWIQTAGATSVEEPSVRRLQGLNLIRGRDQSGLMLGEPISRAEFVTLIVRAFGKEELAAALTGTDTNSDVHGHWANGYIAVAKGLAEQRGATIGMPDGTFRPDALVTVPEMVAFLMKYVNVAPAPDLAWPENYLKGSQDAKLIGAEDMAVIRPLGSQLASRGMAFYLADWVFYHHKLPEGGTVYTTFVDTIKPTLTIDSFNVDVAAKQATVTGMTSGDLVKVSAGSAEVSALPNQGRYTVTLPWDPQQAETILVSATDLAGNVAEQSIKQ